jgi:hypothetical protein
MNGNHNIETSLNPAQRKQRDERLQRVVNLSMTGLAGLQSEEENKYWEEYIEKCFPQWSDSDDFRLKQ